MFKLYAGTDGMLTGALSALLEAEGIRCLVKNEHLGGGAGALPLTECWPELWVLEEADLPRARRILGQVLRPESRGREGWRCPACGEGLEGQFEQCWKCGAWR